MNILLKTSFKVRYHCPILLRLRHTERAVGLPLGWKLAQAIRSLVSMPLDFLIILVQIKQKILLITMFV